MKEIMDISFAVFNRHINNAGDRAKMAFIKRFGQEVWDKEIEPFEKQGIMTLFHTEPNTYTEWYTEVVGVLVNEDRVTVEVPASTV
jgi:hypothetical protein